MNSKQLCYSFIYRMCLFVGNKKNHESLRSGQEWLPATCGRCASSELTYSVIETCAFGTSFALSYSETFSRTELFLGYQRNLVWCKPKFIHT